jgi:hypothetical protein
VQRATAAMYAPFGGTATVRSVRGLTLSGTHLARANLLFSPVQMLRTMRSEAVSQRAPPLAACLGLLTWFRLPPRQRSADLVRVDDGAEQSAPPNGGGSGGDCASTLLT